MFIYIMFVDILYSERSFKDMLFICAYFWISIPILFGDHKSCPYLYAFVLKYYLYVFIFISIIKKRVNGEAGA